MAPRRQRDPAHISNDRVLVTEGSGWMKAASEPTAAEIELGIGLSGLAASLSRSCSAERAGFARPGVKTRPVREQGTWIFIYPGAAKPAASELPPGPGHLGVLLGPARSDGLYSGLPDRRGLAASCARRSSEVRARTPTLNADVHRPEPQLRASIW